MVWTFTRNPFPIKPPQIPSSICESTINAAHPAVDRDILYEAQSTRTQCAHHPHLGIPQRVVRYNSAKLVRRHIVIRATQSASGLSVLLATINSSSRWCRPSPANPHRSNTFTFSQPGWCERGRRAELFVDCIVFGSSQSFAFNASRAWEGTREATSGDFGQHTVCAAGISWPSRWAGIPRKIFSKLSSRNALCADSREREFRALNLRRRFFVQLYL